MRFAFLFYTLMLGSGLLPAQTRLQRAIDELAASEALAHGGLSIAVVDIESGKQIAAHHPGLSLIPASTLKLLTTASALGILGRDYSFRTELQYDGEIGRDGVLRGNLYLKGYGDPTLGSGQMEQAASLDDLLVRLRMAVQQRGIRRIEGYIVGDASWFNTAVAGPGWQWTDMGNYYAAGAWGLNLHENLYYLHFQQRSRLGEIPPVLYIEPEVGGLRFFNEVESAPAGSGDNAYIYGAPRTFERFIRGTIPVGAGRFTIKGSIPDPPLFAAQQLLASLRSVGILCSGGSLTQLDLERQGAAAGARQTLYTHRSPPLSAIVRRTNLKSVNLYCEVMLRAIGQQAGGEGSAGAGIEAVRAFWGDRGLDFDGIFLEDGSGLSPRNGVTSAFMAGLLRKVARDERLFLDIYDSLPVAGESGGMQASLRGTAASGKVRAKTGTLDRVRALAGYTESRSGRRLSFCILANNYTCDGAQMRRMIDKVLLAMWESGS